MDQLQLPEADRALQLESSNDSGSNASDSQLSSLEPSDASLSSAGASMNCSPPELLQVFSEAYGKYAHGQLALGLCVVGIITNVANMMVCTCCELLLAYSYLQYSTRSHPPTNPPAVSAVQVLTRHKMRASPTNCILAAIAAANLLTSAVCIPVYVHFYLARDKALPPLATRSLPWAAYLWLQGNLGILFHTASVWLTIQLALFRCALPLSRSRSLSLSLGCTARCPAAVQLNRGSLNFSALTVTVLVATYF